MEEFILDKILFLMKVGLRFISILGSTNKIKDLKDLDNGNIVKVVTKENLDKDQFSKANNFLRKSIFINCVNQWLDFSFF